MNNKHKLIKQKSNLNIVDKFDHIVNDFDEHADIKKYIETLEIWDYWDRKDKNEKIIPDLWENFVFDIKNNGWLHVSEFKNEPDHDQEKHPFADVYKCKHYNNIYIKFRKENGKIEVMSAHKDYNINN